MNNQTTMDTQTDMSRTNFGKVCEFNRCAEVDRCQLTSASVFTEKRDLIKQRMELIREEVRELECAVSENDMVEVRDALADILYVVYGMQDAMGIDGDSDFDVVHESNMSKFCNTLEEANATVSSYQEKYEKSQSPYDSPYHHYLENEGKWVVKNKSTGKILKSINYNKVKW